METRRSLTLGDLPIAKQETFIKEFEEMQKLNLEAKRQYYVKNLFKFNKNVLHVDTGEAEGKKKVELAPVHKELCDFVQFTPKPRKLILMPRGHLKSTLITVGYSLLRIAQDPSVRILIMNATYLMAVTFLGQIRKHLQFNETFRELYGELDKNASKWKEDMITVFRGEVGGDYSKKEPTVTAWGIGGSLVSQHYDLIIADDIVARENIGTKEQIEKVILAYKDALDLLEPDGEVIVIGTRWHDADLYGYILDPNNNLLDGFDVFIRQAVENGNLEIGNVLFPQKYSREYLKQLKAEKGSSEFSAQYLNDPVPPDTAIFLKSEFRTYDTSDIAGKVLNRFTFIDPALTTSKGSDFTAIVTLGMDQYSNVFILDIFRRQIKPSELIRQLFEINEVWQPLNMFIEEAANQKVLRPFAEQEMRARGKFLPLKEVKPGFRETKEMRIMGLQSWYERGQIFHKEGLANIDYLQDELLRFPRGKHDDIIDALGYFPGNIYPPRREARVDEDEPVKNKYLY